MKYIATKDIPIDEIDATDRLRPLDPNWVAALAESIGKIGQKEPIEVVALIRGKKKYRLVAGGHRLAGCIQAGLTHVRAEIKQVEGDDFDLECRLHEIDENLIRNELNALDRAVFLGERQKIYEAMYPESARGGDRKSAAALENQNDIVSFSSATAEKIDLHERTIQRAVAIFKGIPAEIRTRLAGTTLALKQGELYQLTHYSAEQQGHILDMCLRTDDPVASIKIAADIIDGHARQKPTAADADYQKLYDTWKRCASKPGRRRFMESLVEMGIISGFNEGQL